MQRPGLGYRDRSHEIRRRLVHNIISNWNLPPKNQHVDDADSSPVRAEIFTGYPHGKSNIMLNFL